LSADHRTRRRVLISRLASDGTQLLEKMAALGITAA
jgi:hypothetical protein